MVAYITKDLLSDFYTVVENPNAFAIECKYDSNGMYLGQWQVNCLDSEPGSPAMLFFSAEMIGGKPHVNGKSMRYLTKEAMTWAGSNKGSRLPETIELYVYLKNITRDDETGFLSALCDERMRKDKLICVRITDENRIEKPIAEIRLMPTAGGVMYGIAPINHMGQRGSGIYTNDYEEAFIRAVDIEKRGHHWIWVPNIEHNPYVDYNDYL